MKFHLLAAASGLALSAFLIASPAVARQYPRRTAIGSMPMACPPPIPRRRNRPKPPRINNQDGVTTTGPALQPTRRPTPTMRSIRRSSSNIRTSCSRIRRRSSEVSGSQPRPI